MAKSHRQGVRSHLQLAHVCRQLLHDPLKRHYVCCAADGDDLKRTAQCRCSTRPELGTARPHQVEEEMVAFVVRAGDVDGMAHKAVAMRFAAGWHTHVDPTWGGRVAGQADAQGQGPSAELGLGDDVLLDGLELLPIQKAFRGLRPPTPPPTGLSLPMPLGDRLIDGESDGPGRPGGVLAAGGTRRT